MAATVGRSSPRLNAHLLRPIVGGQLLGGTCHAAEVGIGAGHSGVIDFNPWGLQLLLLFLGGGVGCRILFCFIGHDGHWMRNLQVSGEKNLQVDYLRLMSWFSVNWNFVSFPLAG